MTSYRVAHKNIAVAEFGSGYSQNLAFSPNPAGLAPANILVGFLDLAGFEKSAMLPDNASQLVFL